MFEFLYTIAAISVFIVAIMPLLIVGEKVINKYLDKEETYYVKLKEDETEEKLIQDIMDYKVANNFAVKNAISELKGYGIKSK